MNGFGRAPRQTSDAFQGSREGLSPSQRIFVEGDSKEREMNALDLFQLRGMGRLLRREEIAFAIAFLVDASTWGTGQLVMVDASYNTARQKR
jgi:hypothetical protein